MDKVFFAINPSKLHHNTQVTSRVDYHQFNNANELKPKLKLLQNYVLSVQSTWFWSKNIVKQFKSKSRQQSVLIVWCKITRPMPAEWTNLNNELSGWKKNSVNQSKRTKLSAKTLKKRTTNWMRDRVTQTRCKCGRSKCKIIAQRSSGNCNLNANAESKTSRDFQVKSGTCKSKSESTKKRPWTFKIKFTRQSRISPLEGKVRLNWANRLHQVRKIVLKSRINHRIGINLKGSMRCMGRVRSRRLKGLFSWRPSWKSSNTRSRRRKKQGDKWWI
jgi:hypothetical protein